jgi:hypothetical protein
MANNSSSQMRPTPPSGAYQGLLYSHPAQNAKKKPASLRIRVFVNVSYEDLLVETVLLIELRNASAGINQLLLASKEGGDTSSRFPP